MTRFTKSAIAIPDLSLPELNLPDLAFSDLSLPDLSLPNLSLSDSLSSLVAMANQLQAVVNGAIAHPIWAIALILLTITLIQIIADLAKRIVKATLAFALRLPFSLSQWLWRRATAPSIPDKSAQVHQLIERLESLRAEQDQIIAQLKQLLSDQSSSSPPHSRLKRPAKEQPAKEQFTEERPAEEQFTEERPTEKQSTEEQTQPASTGASKSSSTVSPEVG